VHLHDHPDIRRIGNIKKVDRLAGERAALVDQEGHNGRMSLEFSERVKRVPVYPAASHYALSKPNGEGSPAFLASNESPYPPLPEVKDAIWESLSDLNRYPDPSNAELRQTLSGRYEVPQGQIAIGNGSCDILLAAGEALLEPGAEFVFAWPSFSVYLQLVAASGARPVRVALDSDERHDLEAMLREITVATRLVIVCNPNNPTSTALPLADIAAFVEAVPAHVCVIVDEAYCEFNLLDDPDASIALLRSHPNLMLLRTFSKVYGLCGLRVGFGLCGSEALPRALDRIRQPFYCNAVAQAAAIEALKHEDAVIERVTKTVAEREAVTDGLRTLGLEPSDSQANFSWFSLGDHDEAEVMRGLEKHGVLVRGGGALGSEHSALRVTYGTPEENERFLEAIAEVLGPVRRRERHHV
jgi:histidinol-phosphate aminotransferase